MGEKVLFVDDDPDIARLIEVNLATQGFEVHLPSEGVEAPENAMEIPPPLALVDEVQNRQRQVERLSLLSIEIDRRGRP